MRRNNKGFVVSAVLYPLLVLFLALIMGLLSMSDTRKRILDKMKLEISDSIFDEATCSCDTILNKLNYLIKNGVSGVGGGGGSYQQNVLGVSVKPYGVPTELPSVGNGIGDIAVITDVEIDSYYVSSDAPSDPKHGTVWIVQDKTSNYHIKSDYSKIGISYAMQYICNDEQTECEWELKKSYVYDEAKWKLLYYVSLKDGLVDLTASDLNAEVEKTFGYTGEYQIFSAHFSGWYKIELWGAQGGSYQGATSSYYGGYGAYTKGEIYLNAGEMLYVYVGGEGDNYATTANGGWNGGGSTSTRTDQNGVALGGGGATDIRLESTTKKDIWNEFDSLKSRIMVAAGGGGAIRYYASSSNYGYGIGGYGGTLIGGNGYFSARTNGGWDPYHGTGGTQSMGGYQNNVPLTNIGGFGLGANSTDNGAGGGGGYYGGGSSSSIIGSGGGGSSYISGHSGCSSIAKESTEENIIHTGSNIHYNNYYFKNTEMMSGKDDNVPTYDGKATMTGNKGNGYAKITLLTVEIREKTRAEEAIDENNSFDYMYAGENIEVGSYQIFTAPRSGMYKLQTWGAQGGSYQGATSSFYGGYGAYASGDIYLEKGKKLYIYVGSQGNNYKSIANGGWNGGGSTTTANSSGQASGGGGATDIRLFASSDKHAWNEFDSLKSRIMVAAGGGGAIRYYVNSENYAYGIGGYGGTLIGGKGYFAARTHSSWDPYYGTGGTQSMGGYQNNSLLINIGNFGVGSSSNTEGGGGGGGYYGGGSVNSIIGVGGGGSSYISGYEGCSSIEESSTSVNIIHNGNSVHYSGYYFDNASMLAGNDSSIPSYDGNTLMTGNKGNGYAKITYLNSNTSNKEDIRIKEHHYSYSGTNLENGKYQIFKAPISGTYKVELWGAQGTSYSHPGGNGGYTKGEIYLNANETMYIYVGSQSGSAKGGWNGGGDGAGTWNTYHHGFGGGGATDIRLVNTSAFNTWNEFNSLKSRIMVAAGGGGAGTYYSSSSSYSYGTGGAGGGLTGSNGTQSAGPSGHGRYVGIGAGQATPGYRYDSWKTAVGGFGYGGNSITNNPTAGGGGGYYGGGGGTYVGSGGGSSYISGHEGCNSIEQESISDNIIHNGSAYHYSGKYFNNTLMESGKNTGNGKAIISLLKAETISDETLVQKALNDEKIWKYTFSGTDLYSGRYQVFEAPANAEYKIELWGAQGADFSHIGGKGGYTAGNILLKKGEKLYIYIGGFGHQYDTAGGWNGGGRGSGTYENYHHGFGGGGATDIRLVNTSSLSIWNEFDSLKSRIMVAAGGGSAGTYYYNSDAYSYGTGGAGGGLVGSNGTQSAGPSGHSHLIGRGGTQSLPGYREDGWTNLIGGFGYGGTYSSGAYSGGGGGYYGGGGGTYVGAGGGSSYISGHDGCSSIEEESTANNIIHNGSAYHYSGYYFDDTIMLDGNSKEQPTFAGSGVQSGNSGHGAAKITLLSKTEETRKDIDTLNEVYNYSFSGTSLLSGRYQVFNVSKGGTYKIELWGAQGADHSHPGGKGGYTSGEISMKAGEKLYIYVGGHSYSRNNKGGWNGGGSATGTWGTYHHGFGGGGATDIRVKPTTGLNVWNELDSLKSRIMVAAGGGGAGTYYYNSSAYSYGTGGAGGGLVGVNGVQSAGPSGHTNLVGTAGTQIAGGYRKDSSTTLVGGFGYGASANDTSGAGGGGGWYGGGGGTYVGSGGGSSYISGHAGCIAIDSAGNPITNEYSSINDSISYTKYKFSNTAMIDGQGYPWSTVKSSSSSGQPTNDGGSTQVGQSGSGFAKITYLGA